MTRYSSVFISSFSHYKNGKRQPKNGMIDPLLSFFGNHVRHILLVDQPHPISDSINPIIEIFRNGRMIERRIFSSWWYVPLYLYCRLEQIGLTRVSYKLRDFYSTLFVAVTRPEHYDLFIGLEAINAIAGILLRKMGKVKTVVYYVSDYSPARFSAHGKTILNSLYVWLDRYCVKHADFTWDVSPAIKDARITAGLSSDDTDTVIHVPNGLFPSQIHALPLSKRTSNSLVYLGTLDPEFGVGLAIKSLHQIRKKISDVQLHIIGSGYELKKLQQLAKRLKIIDAVVFHGYVQKNDDVAALVRSAYVGLAPYRAFADSYRWYADAGKIRQYLASGLPVVTTHVPPLGRLIVEQGAGVLTKDTVKSFSDGIIQLLTDENYYKKLARQAKKISKDNTWEHVYANALLDMQKIEKALYESCQD